MIELTRMNVQQHDSNVSTTEIRTARNPIHVLMLVRLYYPWIGGTERQAHKLSLALKARGIEVTVATGWWFRHTPQRETIEGVPVYRNFTMWEMFGIRGLRKFGAYLYLITLLFYLWRRRREYDLIHVHLLNYHAFAAVLAGKWLKKRTIIKIANSGSRSDLVRMYRNELIPGTRQMLPLTLEADRFVAISRVIAEELRAAGVAPEKIVAIPNGVEIDAFRPKDDYRLHSPVTLIYLGRLHPQKRLDVLLRAFQQVAADRPKLCWRLLLMGDGPARSSLESMVQEFGGAGEVLFCGQTDDIFTYLTQADLFVLPSQTEGMSNALLEAMACGMPCIASRVSGNLDLIKDGQNGRLVDCGEVEGLAQAIVDLVDDDERREWLGRAARQTIEEGFTLERVVEQYITLYQNLLTEDNL